MFKTILTTLVLTYFSINAKAEISERVQIKTFDGVILKGVIEVPSEVKGAVLLLQGSGNVGMDGDVSSPILGSGYQGQPAKLSEELSQHLSQLGIATLRFSKRGIDDPAQLQNQTLPFLTEDAVSAYRLLESRFPGLRIGLVGFSEGATLATLVANQLQVKSLFLLALPTRPIDEVFGYQFMGWPTELLAHKLDPHQTGEIDLKAFEQIKMSMLPLSFILSPASPQSIDLNGDQKISIHKELSSYYQNFYYSVRAILESPGYAAWYHAYQKLKPFHEVAANLKSDAIFIYQGLDDAQVKWSWILEDAYALPIKPVIHFFPKLGHCFSPMDGVLGEVKTTGPFSNQLLNQLGQDILLGLKINE